MSKHQSAHGFLRSTNWWNLELRAGQTFFIYIYIPEGPGVLRWRSGAVGWGGACYRHVHVTLIVLWWEGWGGVGHVTVMFMLRWCYVDGGGGVGWGMLPSCSCYVDATLMGGVGWGGVGWGMLPSCSCYVDATLMGVVGWGGACYRHVHVTLMLRWWEGWGGVGHVTVMFMLRWLASEAPLLLA